jgi:NADH:ubiquinone oxidoreductase subunit C
VTSPDLAGLARARGDQLAAATGGQASDSFGQVTVDVPAQRWKGALLHARDELGLTFFDWLSAVDELGDGFWVVCHLADPLTHVHLLVRTRLPADGPALASATGVFRGAGWHERETHEMFGIDFPGHPGHPHIAPLLLPDGFEGRPLRKDFVLAARVAKAWPGAKEPGESEHDTPTRRRTLPPGVPDPQVWGPHPPASPGAPEVSADEGVPQ